MITLTYDSRPDHSEPDKVLGVIEHSVASREPSLDAGFPVVTVHSADEPDRAFYETWSTTEPVVRGRRRNLIYSHDGETLFCAGVVPESGQHREMVRDTYLTLLELIDELGYTLYRVWNHVARINDDNANGLERYRDFCQGRAEALEGLGADWLANLPAATGVGAHDGGIVVYCLATRSLSPVHFENPRQIPAYRYPPKYGPRSPSFARASLLPSGRGDRSGTLFVSGTASVVGHETVHPGDLAGQCKTTVENLQLLLDHIADETGAPTGLDRFRFAKAYVRHPEDIPYVETEFRRVLGEGPTLQLLNVDICRSDLLVEVEGIVELP